LQNNNKKICIVTSSLGKGGAEQSTALLSKMLVQIGYQVHLVTILNIIDYDYSGELLNLGRLKDQKDGFFARISRLSVFKKYLKQHQFDFIIDNRTRNSWFRETVISKIIYRPYKVIYVLRSYNLDYYFPKNKILAKLLYKNASAIVSVSEEIKQLVEKTYGFKNVSTIYNPIENNPLCLDEIVTLNYNYILAYGRLDEDVKNYTLLFEAYKISSLSKENIKLVLLGSGKDLSLLKQKVDELKLEKSIYFIPFNNKPLEIVVKAKFVCLTSRFEGFPRVLIESLSVGTPVISVNCKSGPSEIITNKDNGLLVENYDVNELADAMNSFIFDKRLYQHCKANAKQSVAKFSVEEISKDWKKLIESK